MMMAYIFQPFTRRKTSETFWSLSGLPPLVAKPASRALNDVLEAIDWVARELPGDPKHFHLPVGPVNPSLGPQIVKRKD